MGPLPILAGTSGRSIFPLVSKYPAETEAGVRFQKQVCVQGRGGGSSAPGERTISLKLLRQHGVFEVTG